MGKFYVGIDIGTNSVGMACTDEQYKLLRANGKDCWAVRLFDSSETAEKRRIYRTARRRLDRRKQRIGFLQGLFAPYIEDKNFFLRLNNSQYYPSDKVEILGGNKNNLFADSNYDDKQYHLDFPTIYHLRNALQIKPISDLRLYYLALHHIVKYRGHFLSNGSMEEVRDFGRLCDELTVCCAEIFCDAENVPSFSEKAKAAKTCLMDGQIGMREKQAELSKLFGSDRLSKEIIKGICGATVSPKVLFGEEYKDFDSVSFKNLTEDAFYALQGEYGENFVLFEKMRAIYNYILFEKLLEGKPNISCAMIKLHEDHKNDLKILKEFLKANASPETYQKFFKSKTEKDNYVSYIGYTKKGGDKIKVKKSGDKVFFDALKKLLHALPDVKDVGVLNDILNRIDSGTFLPKILHSDNGLFPHQVNEAELVKIVDNMVKQHPETSEMAQKILPLFRFRVPYYVGPLTGKNSWVEKNSNEKITPWNFDEVVDKAKSNEKFMRRMTNKCTYLFAEDVLPQASIYYQKYDVLNQLNVLQINNIPISVELKQKIFDELFMKRPRVTDKVIIDFLVRQGLISENEKRDITLSGKDGEFKANMRSYVQLKKILGDFVDEDLKNGGGVCENIILWHTLNTDKEIVNKLIKDNYGQIKVIKDNLKQLKSLQFEKFGRFSKKFLTGLCVDCDLGERMSILDLLYETNQNLNQILFKEEYDFSKLLKAENGELSSEIDYDAVKELYVSPIVRRGVWQTLQMMDEYVTALKKAPDKIFIEVTREDGVKGDEGRSVSRKSLLKNRYSVIKKIDGIKEIAKELEGYTELNLRQERLFLYFRQLGRCMYSGEKIDLDNLNSNLYDVDHILPRCFVKDDSLDNKVLVLRKMNAEKKDIYPLPENFRGQTETWKMLYAHKLISDKTLNLLMRVDPLGEDDFKSFINRQVVVTNQTIKAVVELLGRKYPQTKIIYSKSKNISDFRQKFELFKCRETNDLHHARDAYLNIVVGNVFNTCYSSPFKMYHKVEDTWRLYNLKTMFNRDVAGAWDTTNSIKNVKSVYEKTSMSVTRYSYITKGKFYDETVFAHGDNGISLPRKGVGILSNSDRYGGYKSQQTAYFSAILSQNKKGEVIKTIEAIPVLAGLKIKDDSDELKKYFEESCGMQNVEILIPKIKCKQLITYNNMPLYITGVTGDQIKCLNAIQLFTDNKTDEYIKALVGFYNLYRNSIDDMTGEEYIIKTNRKCEVKLKIDRERNCELYELLCSKLDNRFYAGLKYCLTFKNILKDGFSKFVALSVAKQVSVLLQILNFFQCNALLSNLTAIGGSAMNGTLLFNKNITKVNLCLIHQSPCGLKMHKQKV